MPYSQLRQEIQRAPSGLVRAATSDPYLQSMCLPDWEQDYTQLSAGRFSGQVAHINFGRASVFRETLNQATDQRARSQSREYRSEEHNV